MNAVFYCRVSTDEEAQVNALGNQIAECEGCIKKMGWRLVDSYIDEGKSGTSVKKRDEYQRLVRDLEGPKYDVIVIKSQDRLMRNTKEWYLFVDKLVSNQKQLYFYLENKFYTADDALITGIKAILAEEYSRELSKKINNAHRNRQEAGSTVLLTSATWGYKKVNKQVVVDAAEAEVVRLMFELCAEGYGSRSISKILSNKGIYSRTGKPFPEVTIRKIIRNPLFKGTVVMNKRSVDFQTKRTTRNPQEEWKVHENAVPAIVSEALWEEANRRMDQRRRTVKSAEFGERMIGKNMGKHELSGKILCGDCGSTYWRRYRRGYKDKDKVLVDWSCSEYVRRGRKKAQKKATPKNKKIATPHQGCDNIHLSETDLDNILKAVAKKLFAQDKDVVLQRLAAVLKEVYQEKNWEKDKKWHESSKAKILGQKNRLIDMLIDETITKDDYKRKNALLEEQLAQLETAEKEMAERAAYSENMEQQLVAIQRMFDESLKEDVDLIKLSRYIDKILVFPERLEIYFNYLDAVTVKLRQERQRASGGQQIQRKSHPIRDEGDSHLYIETGEYLTAVNNQISQPILCHQKLSDDDTDEG